MRVAVLNLEHACRLPFRLFVGDARVRLAESHVEVVEVDREPTDRLFAVGVL